MWSKKKQWNREMFMNENFIYKITVLIVVGLINFYYISSIV